MRRVKGEYTATINIKFDLPYVPRMTTPFEFSVEALKLDLTDTIKKMIQDECDDNQIVDITNADIKATIYE